MQPAPITIAELDADSLDRQLDALADILVACVHDGASVSFVLPFGRDEARAFWIGKVAPGVARRGRALFVATLEGALAGTAQLDLDTTPNQRHRGEVSKVLVDPRLRRRGVARALMAAIETRARAAQRWLLTLDTAGEAAERLYLSLGYERAGRIPFYARDPIAERCDATTLMYKDLRRAAASAGVATPPRAGVRACIFDAYGTLFDFASAAARCPDIPQAHRGALTALWRDKQLQYTWLRTLQGRYVDFAQVTGDALDFALDSLGLATPQRRASLMALYRRLAAFAEVPDALTALRSAGFKTAILSNGSPAMLHEAVDAAGLGGLFDAVLSADAVGAFKTHPSVYALAIDRLGVAAREAAFVSANGWDAWAAADFGMRALWCNRAGQPPERLPGAPEAEVKTLAELPALLGAAP